MSLLAALILALMGALGTAWIVWLRREAERDIEILSEQISVLSMEVAALRASVEELRLQSARLYGATEATHAELTEFVHGPPSMRRPIVIGP